MSAPPSAAAPRMSARHFTALMALCTVLMLLAATPAAHAQMHEIDADDLRLVYPKPVLDYLAPYTARCFENSMRFHKRLWGYAPSEKVNVILDDLTDYGNAGVWVNPRNSMVVHIAPSNFVYETGPSNERMNFTMNHEVVHVLALDKTAGADGLWRGMFHGKVRETNEHPETILYGHLTLPRRAAPRWYHEGIAVFMETWMAGGLGRAQGPYDEMVFRAMVRDSAHFYDPLGLESEGTRIDFQVGVNAYLYGTRFMTYLGDRYSPAKVLEWVGRLPGSKRYFASQFQHVFGASLGSVWSDWIRDEHRFQQANLDSLRLHPATPWRDLSPMALGSVSRAYLDSSSHALIAAVYHPGSVAQLAAIPLSGGAPRTLREVKGPALYFVSSLAFDPHTRTVFYTTDNNEWRDLRAYDLATGRSRTLIHDARLGDLAFDPATRALWAVRHFNGISTFVRLEAPYTDWHAAVSLPYGLDAFDLDIAPDGRTMAASFAEISGRQTLRVLDVARLAQGDTTTRIVHDFGSAIPSGFVFDATGTQLIGSSYYTGVSNLWRYDIARDSMDIVTNAETGFFRPVPLGGDSVVAFRYSGQGFTPAILHIAPLTDVSAITYLGQRIVEHHPELESWKVPPPSRIVLDSATVAGRPYAPLRSVRFATAYPVVEAYKDHVAPGWNLDFSDPLQFHQFSLTGTYSPQQNVPSDERVHAQLRYRRFDLTLALRWNPASFYDLVGPTKVSRKGIGQAADWHRTLIHDKPRELEFALRASHWSGLERLPDQQNVATSAGFDQLLSGGAELRYKNLRSSIGAADFEVGHSWWLAADENGVRFARAGSGTWRGFPFLQGGLDAGHPLPGIRNSSLWLRTAAGIASSQRDEPFANYFFGGFGNNLLDTGEPKRYRDADRFAGAALDDIAGTNYVRGMLDWNLPALRFRRAGTLALYASWARLSLFGGGIATDLDDAPTKRRLANAGAQLDIRMQLLTQSPLTLSVGWASAFEKGVLPTRQWMASLKVL